MRSLPLAFVFSALVLFPGSVFAGDARPHKLAAITVKAKTGEASPNSESYRGYYSDLSAIADRKDFPELADGLRHQIDIVESSGLNSRVLRTLPNDSNRDRRIRVRGKYERVDLGLAETKNGRSLLQQARSRESARKASQRVGLG